MNKLFPLLLVLLAACGGVREKQILVFYPAGSPDISQKITEIIKTGTDEGIKIDTLSSLEQLNDKHLQPYSAVALLEIPGTALDYKQQTSLERYVQAGGGLIGIGTDLHSRFNWPWYNDFLAQTSEKGHDEMEIKQVNATSKPEASTALSGNYEFDGGRLCFLSSDQLPELGHCLSFAIGENKVNYKNAKTPSVPENSRFTRKVLDNAMNEPMEMDILPDGRVIYIERRGPVKLYDPATNSTKLLAQFDVCTEGNYEDGMLGIALDPGFQLNNRLFIYYSPAGVDSVQRLSRFFLAGDSLIMASEKKILDVPVQRETCCHSGGSVQFGPDGLLYLSTGDNTSSKESNGYTPIDERPGRGPFDAQKSSGNTHDLRGKVLRIKVTTDGTYSIPEGNLFPKDGSQGRPEIYTMGCRNPFRISIDHKTGYLYWGDVGPDSGTDSEQGPQSYDEWNQARQAGNFGWPYFVGDNKAYPDFDFVTNTPGEYFDPENPINDSPNNYGSQNLPPAQLPMIWYPYGESELWPELGKGSRSAMAGPVYYADRYPQSSVKFPSYYDGKLFIYEWARSWIKVVSFDENHHPIKIEPFMSDMPLSKPIDMEFGPDGAMYLLEYGANYFANNDEARLVKIEYAESNRAPVPQIAVDKTAGGVPVEVNFSAASSYDFDEGDSLQFAWMFTEEETQASGAEATFTFTEPGVYTPKLTVTDDKGSSATATVKIKVGNEPPQITFAFDGNQSFFYDNETLRYEVVVEDKEDGKLNNGIDPEAVKLQFNYLPQGKDLALLGPNAYVTPYANGKNLMDESDCKSCHSMNKASVGPSYMQIAERYDADDKNVAYLGDKIITGGNGNWGHSLMAAHPQHTMEETSEMVRYILSLGEAQGAALDIKGVLPLNKHKSGGEEGTYILSATYKDKGGNSMPALSARKTVRLRHPKVEAEDYEDFKGVQRQRPQGGSFAYVGGRVQGNATAYLVFNDIDLSQIASLTYNAALGGSDITIALHLDAPDGPKVSEVQLSPTGGRRNFSEVTTDVVPTNGLHDLYFVIKGNEDEGRASFGLDWIYFHTNKPL